MPKDYSFEIIQGGIAVASGSGPDLETVRREANHYAIMYAQDGPVEVKIADMAFFPEPKG